MARASGFVRGASGGVRRLSSRAAAAVGRPSPAIWSARTVVQSATSKMSVRRLMRRDPAVGKSLPLADKITDTHIDINGPRGTGISARDRSAPPRSNVRQVSNRGTNRSIDKR